MRAMSQGKATHPNKNNFHKQFAQTLSACVLLFLKGTGGTTCTDCSEIRRNCLRKLCFHLGGSVFGVGLRLHMRGNTLGTVPFDPHRKLPQSTVKPILPSNETCESKAGCKGTLASCNLTLASTEFLSKQSDLCMTSQ